MQKNQLVETRNIRIGAPQLHGTMTLPKEARGLIIFAHGSGSSRRALVINTSPSFSMSIFTQLSYLTC